MRNRRKGETGKWRSWEIYILPFLGSAKKLLEKFKAEHEREHPLSGILTEREMLSDLSEDESKEDPRIHLIHFILITMLPV